MKDSHARHIGLDDDLDDVDDLRRIGQSLRHPRGHSFATCRAAELRRSVRRRAAQRRPDVHRRRVIRAAESVGL